MFTHLHVHTEYSMLDGLSRVGPLVQRAKELGMDSLAITDHGGMYGAVDFYKSATEAGIKPILGCEIYVAPGSRHSKTPADKSPYHLTVLAKNSAGYANLVKLVTKAHLEGFYYKPRVDRELLEEYSEGLIALSGCPSGEVSRLLANGQTDDARSAAAWYRELFGDYYLEMSPHEDVPERPAINRGLLDLHGELDIPVVATNDSHYVNREDAQLQDILICIHTNTNIQDQSRLKMESDAYYLRSPEEMAALFGDLPEAISNTERIAEMCELELDFSRLRLPEFQVPDGATAEAYLATLCWEGFGRRLEHGTDKDKERLAYELEVIKQTRLANYFLVVWDIAQFVRQNDIFFAVRGSAAASLALYCLGVTDINPLKYDLVFERLLHVERTEMPDVDLDFQDDRRDEVINYVVSKYGRDHVAQIITFGTLGARASIRDVGRALAMPYADVDNVARLVPFKLHITLREAMQQNPGLREIYDADESVSNLIDKASRLEGVIRHSSTHAAGVVISGEPLNEVVPLQKPIRGDDENVVMTQYAMGPIADLGLLKIDFLGLVNLTILAKAREMIAATTGAQVNPRDIPLEDSSTFELLSRGETAGVFQLEGAGMTRYIKELKPTSLGDVAAMIALYRPGPMENIGLFIDAKHGRAEPHFRHPALKEIVEETYGVIVYQEQVLQIFRTMAGYSLGEADTVRKAMGKKIPEIMAQERDKFIQGSLAQGYTQDLAEEVFALIEPFAGYAFNKAHAVSYGLISYWTAYLKSNYPAEYMTALLNSYIGNTEKITSAVAECRHLGIPVLPPDINVGELEFSMHTGDGDQQSIRYGLGAVKNVGAAAVNTIVESRDPAEPFSSIEQMCRTADMSSLNRKALESLIGAGALDAFGDRAALLTVADRILSLAQSETRLRESGQTTMFDLFGETVPTPLAKIDLPDVRASARETRAWEMEMLGVALSGDAALGALISAGDSKTIVFRSQIEQEMAGKKVVLAGQVSATTERYTREQRPFTIATLDLMDGAVEIFVWENRLEETRGLWEEGGLVMVVGTVRVRDDEISVTCISASKYEIEPQGETTRQPVGDVHVAIDARDPGPSVESPAVDDLEAVPSPQQRGPARDSLDGAQTGITAFRKLNLRILETERSVEDQALLDDMKRLLLEHPGDDEVSLEIVTAGRVVTMEWPPVRVDASGELESLLRELLGAAGRVSVESPVL